MKILLIFIFLHLTFCLEERLTPISSCTKGRITRYTGWENSGSCSLGKHTNAIGPKYMYPSSPNQAFFKSHTQCGICYEMVGPLGVLRTRVENFCPAGSADPLCNGDMIHFDLANNG